MTSEICRLCLSATAAAEDQILCFGVATVAEILLKHFWIELDPSRDVQAFVCRGCWQKVNEFHQFYASLLALHRSRQLDSKPEPANGIRFAEKLEIQLEEPAAADSDADNDADAGDFDCSLNECIKTESADEDDDGGEPDAEPEPPITKRKRGRPRKSDGLAQPAKSIKLEADCEIAAAEASADVASDRLLAQFFTLQCDLCSVALPNLQVARTHHQQVHQQRGYLVCGCGKSFVRNTSIREHCAFHADASQWKCLPCCKIYVSASRLLSHQRASHPAEVAGELRDAGGEGDAAVAEPLKRNSKAQQLLDDELMRRFVPMVCGLCGAGYDSFGGARKHHQVVHQQPGYVECCGKRFVKKWAAVLHCRWHENPKLFDCTICGRNFSGKIALAEHHIRRHPNNAPYSYQCEHCDASFQLNQQLRCHQRSAHPQPDDKRFECFMCHRQFLLVDRLRNHVRHVHDDAASFVCEVCARSFKSRTTYDLHYAVEHGSVSLKCQCPECGKWLKHQGMLRWHQMQHRAVPQRCEECGHVAPTRLALKAHQRLNHTERKHKCLVCEKMFKRSLSLREHMAIHTGVTDLYTCAYCPKTFRSNANMYKHRRQVHAAQFEVDRRAAKIALDAQNAAEVAASMAMLQQQQQQQLERH